MSFTFNLKPDYLKITLNDIELERVEHTKFLGVTIHENLSWKPHIETVCNKVSKATAILAKLKHYLPRYALAIIFNSLCMSHISYALPVWGSAPKSATNRLIKLQKKGIRHVCGAKYNAHTNPLFKKEKILQFDDLFKFQCAKIMHKRLHNRLHSYHSTKLVMTYERQVMGTRQKYDVIIDSQNKNFTRMNSINFKIGNCWNSLPIDIKMLAFKTLPTFSKRIKTHYLSKYPTNCDQRNCYNCK